MNQFLNKDKGYSVWLKELKNKVRFVQIKAAVKVNSELLLFYWELGLDIADKQKNTKWGEGFLKQLSIDLSSEFPGMKGFSLRNLKYIKQWYLFYSSQALLLSEQPIGQQLVAQITQIPWGHNIVIISKCKDLDEAFFVSSPNLMVVPTFPELRETSRSSI